MFPSSVRFDLCSLGVVYHGRTSDRNVSGAENGSERAENRMSRSGAVSRHSKRNTGAGAERGAEAAEQERGGERVSQIGLSAERQIGRSRSTHMLCDGTDSRTASFRPRYAGLYNN